MPAVEFHSQPYRHYLVDGVEQPSVTTVLDVLHRPALVWWGMTTGLAGVADLSRRALAGDLPRRDSLVLASALARGDGERLAKLLTAHKLTVNHIRDRAGKRGTDVHELLRQWATTGERPDPKQVDADAVGYAKAVRKWIEDHDPEPILCETPVGSAEHGYAGTPDLLYRTSGGAALVDLKTSKRVYPTSHFPQLAAYGHALAECGHPRPAHSAVLRVGKSGRYWLAPSTATLDDFLAILGAYRAIKRIEAAGD